MPQPRDFRDRAMFNLVRRAPEAVVRLAGLRGPVRATHANLRVVAPDRIADAAILVDDDAGPLLLHLEFETAPKPDLPWRMLLYNVLLRTVRDGRGRPIAPADRVRSVVVLVAPPAGPVDESLHLDVGLAFRFDVVRLYDTPAAELARDPLLAAFTAFGRDPRPGDLARAARTLQHHEPDKASALVDILITATAASDPTLERALREALMQAGFDFRRSIFFQEGREQGREEGARQVALDLALNFLRTHKPHLLSDAVRDFLHSLDATRLQLAFDRLLQTGAASPDDLLAELRHALDGRD